MIGFPWSVAEKISVVVLLDASMDGQKADFETWACRSIVSCVDIVSTVFQSSF
jgi:hypothetical protein